MFEDTRINSMHLKFRRERIHKHNLEIKEQEKMCVFNDWKKKDMMVKFFQNKFGVHANFKDVQKYTQEQLESNLLKKGLKKKKHLAAIKIQAVFRMYLQRKKYKQKLRNRDNATIQIQN